MTETIQKPQFTGAELDTLIALVERGPLDDGDVPSKAGRNSLIERGFATKIVVNAQDGYNAATYLGRDAYMLYFGTALGGQADSIAEARANRLALRTIKKLK